MKTYDKKVRLVFSQQVDNGCNLVAIDEMADDFQIRLRSLFSYTGLKLFVEMKPIVFEHPCDGGIGSSGISRINGCFFDDRYGTQLRAQTLSERYCRPQCAVGFRRFVNRYSNVLEHTVSPMRL